MKIAMMTRWNAPSGQSAHAEPIGHAWLRMGHELKVFAPAGLDMPLLYREDEPFVYRCYIQDIWGQRERSDYFFDQRPFLDEDYEIFMVEMMYLMPMPELLEIFPNIKKKAKTVLVVHEVGLPQSPYWYKFDWDAIVCFDVRYKEFLVKAFPQEKITIIPFPCHPPEHGDGKQARIRLNLPLDKRIPFAYGFNITPTHIDLFPVMERLSRDYHLLLLLITHHDLLKLGTTPEFVLLKHEMPTPKKLYSYLHACDAYIYYLRSDDVKTSGIGVSSSVAACLGAGRPILVPGYCNFFSLSGKEVIKYSDFQSLEQRLQEVFQHKENIKESLAAAEQYAKRNSDEEIAAQFLKLFTEIKGKQG
jgi:glycosyltransferase involved in cell wall biosynthesis